MGSTEIDARSDGGRILFSRFAQALALVSALASAAAFTVLPATAAAEECPNAAFRAGPSSHLPDCRAYEMVSPPYKTTGGVELPQIAPDGSSVLLSIRGGAAAGLEGYPEITDFGPGAYYSTRRTASGWVTVPDDPPSAEYEPGLIQGFVNLTGTSLDSQTTAWIDRGVWQPGNALDFFLRRPDRSIVDVGPGEPPTAPSETSRELTRDTGLRALGVSADASHLFFNLATYHWPFDKTLPKYGSLYEYVGTGNTTPMLVGVDSSGKQIDECGVMLGGGSPEASTEQRPLFTQNAVSANGSTVFFTAFPCSGSAPPVVEVFARIDNGLPDARTVAISEPSKEDCSACDTEAAALANAQFKGASEDGSKVFFSTTQPLLGGDTSLNIYEYDFDAPPGNRIVRVSGGDATVTNPTAECNALPTISEDGSHVYFIAKGVLTRTPNGRGESAQAGVPNLYMFERDASYPGGRTAFIAQTAFSAFQGLSGLVNEADATPDGRFLVFTSYAQLTADDTGATQQVFEYDAQTGALVRVSIGQDGFNHNGNVPLKTNFVGFPINDATIVAPYYGEEYRAGAYSSGLSVSADGAYVFFQSIVGLTPQAIDQQVIGYTDGKTSLPPLYANNVYEYHAGRVSLISDGQDFTHGPNENTPPDVLLSGTDASGGDVFFSTEDQLVGQDTDTNIDIYDARIGGGFPGPAGPPPCSGEACQGALSGAPTLLSPGSEFQAGSTPPLAGEPAAKPTTPKKRVTRKPKRKKARGGRTRRRGRKAEAAASGGRANRKAGRS